MVTQLKTLSYGPLLAAVLSGLSIPKKTDSVHFIYSKKILNIQTSKNDPPRVAFEILNKKMKSGSDDWMDIKNKPSLELSAGNMLKVRTIGSKTVHLAEMLIVKEPIQIRPPSIELTPVENTDGLTVAQQQRIVEAKLRFGLSDSDWSGSSHESSIQEIIKKELGQQTNRKSDDRIQISGERYEVESLRAPEEQVYAANAKKNKGNQRISGMVELKALPPPNGVDWQIRIARYDDGVKIEDASFDSKKSVYQIQVAGLDGSLRAELFDVKTGEVVGEGAIRLSEYSRNQNSKITIRKSTNYYAANFPDFYESSSLITRSRVSRKQPETRVHLASLDTEGKSDSEGNYRFDSLHKNSWMILRAQRKGYTPAIYLSPAGEENSLPLLPEKMITAMRNIISDQKLSSDRSSNGSIVWGQAVQGNHPQKGVSVKIQDSGQSPDRYQDSYQVIYFNQLMIPDPKMTETGENGFFAFVDVEKGFHTIVGEMSGINTSFQNLIVDDESTSTILLQNDFIKNEATVKVFDSFSGHPEVASLNFQSLPQEIQVQGVTKIQTSGIKRLALVQIIPENEEYLPSVQLYNDDNENIHLPLIQKRWLYDIQVHRRINRDERSGTVVGFVNDWNFKVFMGHHEKFSTENIIYFDSRGNVTPKGMMGGGFVIFNVPVGIESIVISDESSEMLYNQVIPVDPSALVTLKY